MDTILEEQPVDSSLYERKITRHELAVKQGISLRYVDELTRNGILPHYKIGRSVRYDLAECEASIRQRFYVRAKARM
jgi:excisionase family DNA binding protein